MNPGLCRNGDAINASPIQFKTSRAGVTIFIKIAPVLEIRGILMEQLLEKPSTFEQRREGYERLDYDKVVYLGHLALRAEVLGINDPLSHLFQYLDRREDSLVGIQEDIETDIAERLPKTPFINHVDFDFTGNDFVSVKDKVSMNLMTANNLQIFAVESALNPGLTTELSRAEIESQEATKLADWFSGANIGSFMVFESLPIGEQKIAISRIYRKTNQSRLEGSFVSLYNSSVSHFNQFRGQIKPDAEICGSELDILRCNYEFFHPQVASTDAFIDYYVGVYDRLHFENDGNNRSFGLVTDGVKQKQDGLDIVRSQPGLTSVYIEAVKALADSGGKVNQDIISINKNLGIGFEFVDGQRLTIRMAHDFLAKTISGIVSVIDRADVGLLSELESSDAGQGSNYAAVSYYGGQATVSGETYSSNGCPEFNRSANEATNGAGSEHNALKLAFNAWGNLEDFGKPKIGVCRIAGCPSHGEYHYIHNRTLVGGCDICVGCHKLFKQGKSPDKIYSEQQKKIENQRTEAEKMTLKRKQETEEQEALRARKRKQRVQNQRKLFNKSQDKFPSRLKLFSKPEKALEKSASRSR